MPITGLRTGFIYENLRAKHPPAHLRRNDGGKMEKREFQKRQRISETSKNESE
jgi:hypothetical protein